jgi:intracellular septation protein
MNDADKVTPAAKPHKSGLLNFALDFGPLLVFFLVYRWNAPESADNIVGTISAIIRSTVAFMVAIIVAAIIAKIKLGRISPMMWLTAILVIGFGGLTLWFNDAKFIQIKPTIIYAGLSGLLFIGLLRGKALLKYVFEAGFDGLDDDGWLKLSRNWAWFFAFLAVLNEIARALFNVESRNFDTWLTLKVWVVPIATFVFAAANIPMLMRHGFAVEEADSDDQSPTP